MRASAPSRRQPKPEGRTRASSPSRPRMWRRQPRVRRRHDRTERPPRLSAGFCLGPDCANSGDSDLKSDKHSRPAVRRRICKTPMKSSASPRPRRPRRSARPTGSLPRSCIPTSIRATRTPRSGSRRSRPPTTCLSDPEKRRRYDAGEIDASGAEKAPPQGRYYREYAGGAGHTLTKARRGYADFAEGDDLFAELLRRSREQARRAPGADLHYELRVPFLDAVNGATQDDHPAPRRNARTSRSQPGSRTGRSCACAARARPAPGEGPPGDALVQIVVEPHRSFTREGDDIHLELPITLKEAALGGEVRAPTTTGSVMLKIPEALRHRRQAAPQGQGGEEAARRGRRIRHAEGGHADRARPRARIPSSPSWTPPAGYDPRKEMFGP